MKVAELREKLSKLDKEEISRLAVEFYKLIPKSKKEDYNIDELISNPKKSKTKSKKTDEIRLAEMQVDIKDFVKNARDMCYISPNKIVPKKEYHNNLTEMVVRLYLSLFESKDAIEFFHNNYYEKSRPGDIKIYILTRILMNYKLKTEIKEELEKARAHGVELRDGLIKLLRIIEKGNRLPEYIPY